MANTKPPSPKILLIGLDGATWKILKPWIKSGQLPWFKKISQHAEWYQGTLQSTTPPLTGPAWTSFQTGVNPGKHGVFDFIKYSPSGTNEPVSSTDIPYPPIWKILSQAGKRSIIVNMPMTYPPQKGGKHIVVSSLMTPPGRKYTNNSAVYKKLQAIHYQVDLEHVTFGSPEESVNNRHQIYHEAQTVAKKRYQAVKTLLNEPWDLFFVLFKATDIVQHLYFNQTNTLKLYQQIETYITSIISIASRQSGNELAVFMCSDHGFHRGETHAFSIFRWLETQGYGYSPQPSLVFRSLQSGYRVAKYLIPAVAKQPAIQQTKKTRLDKQNLAHVRNQRQKSQAWPTPYGLHINNQTITDELLKKLRSLKFNNKKLFKKVSLREDVYHGPNTHQAPHIVFTPNPWVKIIANESQTTMWKKLTTNFAGTHTADFNGILMCKLPTPHPPITKSVHQITDIAPTILDIFKIRIPPHIDGSSILNKQRQKNSYTAIISQDLEILEAL